MRDPAEIESVEGVEACVGESCFDLSAGSLEESESEFGANSEPCLALLLAQQGLQCPGNGLSPAAGDHCLDRLAPVYACVLQDHVPEQVLRADEEVSGDGGMVELVCGLLNVLEPWFAARLASARQDFRREETSRKKTPLGGVFL